MDALHQIMTQYGFLIYPFVLFGSVVESVVTLITAGILIREKYVAFGGIILMGVMGECLHDMLFWYIGRRLYKLKKQKYLFFNLKKIDPIVKVAKPFMGMMVFMSKFAWNLNRLVIISAGYSKMKLKRMMMFSIPASVLWVLVLTFAGYIFADQTKLYRKKAELMLLIIVVMFIAIMFAGVYVKKIVLKYLSNGSGEENGNSDETKKDDNIKSENGN